MEKANKKRKSFRNTLLIVFWVYALVLCGITIFNPNYAQNGILLDSVIDGVVSFAS